MSLAAEGECLSSFWPALLALCVTMALQLGANVPFEAPPPLPATVVIFVRTFNNWHLRTKRWRQISARPQHFKDLGIHVPLGDHRVPGTVD
jgi:hypothetical protein